MLLTGINHLAFITNDLEKTIRFYRDLLGMELVAGIGHHGFRHYFFKFGDNQVAFFEYEEARPMERKSHGTPTDNPQGFDHVSFTVATCEDLFRLKDKLEAAGIEVTGAVDHGLMWSIYFFDPNNIPLEASWDCMELLDAPPSAAIAVEDSPRGLRAAQAAGVSCLIVRSEFMGDADFEGARGLVDSLRDLPRVLGV